MAHGPHLDLITPAARLVGREVLEVDSGTGIVRLAFFARPEFANRHGTVSGGFLAAMLDSTAAAPILAFLPKDLSVVTTDLRVSFERPAPLGRLLGVGRVSEQNEREVHSEAELLDRDGNPLARARASFRIVRRR
jgi:uncharacterized protein (TIGR00369 family)